jgi:hypothetical protein
MARIASMSLELWIASGALLLFAIPLARVTIYQRRYLRIEDVELFVRPLNIENFERLTDPAEEWSQRRWIPSREFKALKRQKIRLCAEHLSRMAHNAEIIQGWSHTEHTLLSAKVSNPSDERVHLIFQITEAATEIRVYTLIARLQVWLWLALRADLLPLWLMPQLRGIRTSAGADILTTYQQLTNLTKTVSQFYGQECSERISSAL